MQRNMFGEA